MSESYLALPQALTRTQLSKLDVIANRALTEVELNYGSGFPHYAGGENGGLSFHNLHHSSFVRAGSEIMGLAFGLSEADRALGRVAAAAHDIVQLKPRGQMERESAEWLAREFRRSGLFNEDPIQIGMLAILGTEPVFIDGKFTQVAATQTYPSRRAERVAMSVACADLGELYAPTGPQVAHDLYKEMQGVSQTEEPSLDGLLDFQRGQLTLVESYRFPHNLGERVFGSLKKEVIAYTADMLQRLECGDIESWPQVVAADQSFLRQHS